MNFLAVSFAIHNLGVPFHQNQFQKAIYRNIKSEFYDHLLDP